MTHRFVHIGDLHLGPNSRNADRRRALDQVIAESIAAGPISAWLFPGDLAHARMEIDDRNFLADRLQRMGAVAPIVICYGNHDQPGSLDVFARLESTWTIYVISRPQTIRVPLATGGVACLSILPYPTRAGLVSMGVPTDGIVDAARGALDVIFMQFAAELQQGIADGCVPLMIGHVNVAGSRVSSGQPNVGQEIELDPLLIARLGPVYVALNHIHVAQAIGGAWYAGSLCRLDWSETHPKSFNRVTYDGALFTVELKPVDVAPMYLVEGRLDRNGFEWWIQRSSDVDDIGKPGEAPAGGWAGCEIRCRYRYQTAEQTALNHELVKAPFAGAARLELDPIGIRERASRSPEVAAAVTLEGKVEAFVKSSKVEWTPSLAAKLSQLQSVVDGAAFLTDIGNQLSPPAARELQEAL